MSQIESSALKAVESAGAEERINKSTENLVEAMIRFGRHAVTRRGGDGSRLCDSAALRKNLAEGIDREVALNRIE